MVEKISTFDRFPSNVKKVFTLLEGHLKPEQYQQFKSFVVKAVEGPVSVSAQVANLKKQAEAAERVTRDLSRENARLKDENARLRSTGDPTAPKFEHSTKE